MSAQLGGHGPTEAEEAILDRADEGMEPEQIAREVKLGVGRVKNVIRCYREGRPDDWQSDARRGSILLLAAIQRMEARASA